MSDTRIDTSSDNECHDQDEDMAKSFFADFQAIAFERARAETAESALATALSDNERLGRERDAILKRAQTAEQWLREANFLVREHKSACADAISQAQAAEAERDTLLAQVEKMRGAMREQRLKPGVRAVIACVQHRATEMGDPKCKAWLNSLAFHLGLQLKRDHIDLSEAIDGSLTDAALTKEPS